MKMSEFACFRIRSRLSKYSSVQRRNLTEQGRLFHHGVTPRRSIDATFGLVGCPFFVLSVVIIPVIGTVAFDAIASRHHSSGLFGASRPAGGVE